MPFGRNRCRDTLFADPEELPHAGSRSATLEDVHSALERHARDCRLREERADAELCRLQFQVGAAEERQAELQRRLALSESHCRDLEAKASASEAEAAALRAREKVLWRLAFSSPGGAWEGDRQERLAERWEERVLDHQTEQEELSFLMEDATLTLLFSATFARHPTFFRAWSRCLRLSVRCQRPEHVSVLCAQQTLPSGLEETEEGAALLPLHEAVRAARPGMLCQLLSCGLFPLDATDERDHTAWALAGSLRNAAAAAYPDWPCAPSELQRRLRRCQRLLSSATWREKVHNACGVRAFSKERYARALDLFRQAQQAQADGERAALLRQPERKASPAGAARKRALAFNAARACQRLSRHVAALRELALCDEGSAKVWQARAENAEALGDYQEAARCLGMASRLGHAEAGSEELQERVQRQQERVQRQLHATPQEVLGVSVLASAAEVRQAYRKACLLWHPDRHVEAKREEDRVRAEHMFRRVQDAYQNALRR